MLAEVERRAGARADPGPSFEDLLAWELSLTVGTKAIVVAGSAIKRFKIAAHSYGFEAELTFCISSELVADPLVASFITRDPIKVRLTLKGCDKSQPVEEPVTLVLNGLVTDKRLVETIAEAREGLPVILRRYFIRFFDPAQVLWRQHRPSDLLAETTLAKAIAAHAVGVNVATDWQLLDDPHDIICLGLGREDHPATFYDFVVWLAASNDGVFEYNATDNAYRVAGSKSAAGEPSLLTAEDVHRVVISHPETVRTQVRVLNSFTERKSTAPVARDQLVTGMHRDVLLTTPIASEVERRVKLETSLDRYPEPGLRVELVSLPLVDLRPGLLAKFDDSFPKTMEVADQDYRIVGVTLEGAAHGESAGDSADLEEPVANYMMTGSVTLESKRQPACLLPPYCRPRYPIHVEAKVVGGGGEDTDRSWLVVDGKDDALPFQKVDVPLWNKVIPVPFDPNTTSGHFFFPPYKNARVLVALDLHTARIARHVDWASTGRLPLESQGNQIVMGRSATDGTFVQHVYEDSKPKLTIKRTFMGDQATIDLHEGGAFLLVEEKEFKGKSEPKFDVTMEVAAAQAEMSSGVQASTTEVSGKLQGGIGEVLTAIDGSVANLTGQLEALEGEINAGIAAVQAELEGLVTTVNETVDSVDSTVSGAKAELLDAALK